MPGYDWGDGHGPVHSRPKKKRSGGGGYGAKKSGSMFGAGAPATAKPPGPAPQGLPPDPQAQAEQLAATRQLQVGDAYGAYQKGNVGYDTGYNAAGARDYSNPYSQAALLDESYKRAKYNTKQNYSSQGMLYDGSQAQMQGENARNYSIGSNDLQTSASRAYQDVDWTRAQNYASYGTGNDSSAFAAILRALSGGK